MANPRVLVVEDEYFQASDLQRALTSLGADVMALVGSLDDARAQIASGGFDVGILDIDLRGDKGFGLADELQGQGIPFVFATGYSPQVIPPRFADVTRWEKPFDPHLLARHVLQLWRRGSEAR
jgi:DNA-binding NtrC family response regulator